MDLLDIQALQSLRELNLEPVSQPGCLRRIAGFAWLRGQVNLVNTIGFPVRHECAGTGAVLALIGGRFVTDFARRGCGDR